MDSTGTMPLSEKWSQEFRALPGDSGPAWLGALKEQAAAQFAVSGLPNRKTEAWKYTPLRMLEQMAPQFRDPADAVTRTGRFPEPLCRAGAGMVEISDGRLSGPLPETTGGLTLLSLAGGLDVLGGPVRRVLESTDVASPGNAFMALNTAFLDQGLVVHVGEDVDAGALLIRYAFSGVLSGAGTARIGNFRLVVLLEPGARLELIEQFESTVPIAGALNLVTQVDLAEGSRLGHVRVQNESDDVVLLTSTSVEQAARSTYRHSGFDLGGGLVRHALGARLAGEAADCAFDGAFVLDRKRHVDNHISVDHAAPGCSSTQFFRGVLGGSSRGVFNGRALIRPGADGSSVRQSNANLLLSALAEMDTKPELEIYADEIEASHGATVGQLDETAIFYLRSRGLSEDQARRILTMAFCHAVTDRLGDRSLAGRISEMINAAMPGGVLAAGEV
jgi:Fe-S cluster assembly protein SufD